MFLLSMCLLLLTFGSAMEGYAVWANILSMICILMNLKHESFQVLFAYRYFIAGVNLILVLMHIPDQILICTITGVICSFLLSDQILKYVIPYQKQYLFFITATFLMLFLSDDFSYDKATLVMVCLALFLPVLFPYYVQKIRQGIMAVHPEKKYMFHE